MNWPDIAKSGKVSIVLTFTLVALLSTMKGSLFYNGLKNFALGLSFLFLGIYLTDIHSPESTLKQTEELGLEGVYYVVVSDIPQIKTKTYKVKAKILGKVSYAKNFMASDAEVILYLSKKIKLPIPGDRFIMRCSFKSIPGPDNPYQFDYQQFLSYQGIHFQTFVNNPNNIINTNTNSASFIQKLAFQGTSNLKRLFKENIEDTVALAVTESLIFGYKEDIPKELVNSYSRTGTLHVLAVSGMHVAVVFLLLAKLFSFLDKIKNGVWIKTIFILLSIWGYCVLTGLAPSILRAGLMISLIIVGKSLSRHYNIYNIIALSAFIILCINPYWIFNVGFQLSFAAVLGIIYFQQFLLPLFVPKNFVFKEIWNILIITLCAQIATFPLSLFYFNQFPNYFLFSNLIIIPLTTLIIYSGTAMVLFSKIPILLNLFSLFTEKMVLLTNDIVAKIEDLPYSLTDGIKINMIQVFLIYVLIFFLLDWYKSFNQKSIFIGLAVLAIIIGISSYDKIIMQNKHSIVYFNAPKFKLILISDGKRSVLLSKIPTADKEMNYIRGWLIHHRVWPLYKRIRVNTPKTKNIRLKEMNLYSKGERVYYKGIRLDI